LARGSLKKLEFLFNIFAMAEVAMAVLNTWYYIEKTANINVKTEFIYKYYRLTHRKQEILEL